MNRKMVWTQLMLFGALSSALFCSCHEDVEYIYTYDYTYRNATPYAVEITGYTRPDSYPVGGPVEAIVHDWRIEAAGTLEIRSRFSIANIPGTTPLYCDSARIVFDGKRVLMCYSEEVGKDVPGDICRMENYSVTEVELHHWLYDYALTRTQYDAAAELAGTEQP